MGAVTRMSVVTIMLDKILRELESKGVQLPTHALKRCLRVADHFQIDHLERAQARNYTNTSNVWNDRHNKFTRPHFLQLDALRKMGSAGKPLFFNQLKINHTVKPW